MEPVTLADLDAVALLNRVDTKFVLTVPRLVALLPSLADEYRVLDIDGRRLHQYRTLYFDTPDFAFYRHHRVGRLDRHKVRSRAYVDSGLTFFEIKAKTSDRRTVKHRLVTPTFLEELVPDANAFLRTHLPATNRSLIPVLQNNFWRVTLVGRRSTERLTLDVSVQFECDGRTATVPGIAIAELKQSDPEQPSPFRELMQLAQVPATSFSKYCVGVALLVPDLEHDLFEGEPGPLENLPRDEISGRLDQSSGWLAVGG